MAGSRLTWGKWCANNGQACIAPDYLLVEESVLPELVCFQNFLMLYHSADMHFLIVRDLSGNPFSVEALMRSTASLLNF
jgi:hypothetical protein